jgi:putative tryptophan/tyrosine transport system substrate-binding protein
VRRREFIAGLGSAVAWPASAEALPVIGFIGVATPTPQQEAAFSEGLAEVGFFAGRNVAIESRRGQPSQFPKLASELVRRQVGVIAAVGSTPAALGKASESQRLFRHSNDYGQWMTCAWNARRQCANPSICC